MTERELFEKWWEDEGIQLAVEFVHMKSFWQVVAGLKEFAFKAFTAKQTAHNQQDEEG